MASGDWGSPPDVSFRLVEMSGKFYVWGFRGAFLTDQFDRLIAALAERYAIERELGEGGPGKSSVAGATTNRDETFAQFGQYLEGTGGTFKAELRYVAADEDGRVVGVHHNSGARNGKRLDTDCCITFRMENGRIVEGKEHFQNQENWDAFWA